MERRTRLVVASVAAVIAVGVGAGFGVAAGGDDGRRLGGSARDRASAAALEYVGSGTVTETEAGDGEAAYEVEVRRDDGSVTGVRLDANFVVVGTESEDDESNDIDGAEDDG
jgi:hypothetical protein